jgi:hypothetical protein
MTDNELRGMRMLAESMKTVAPHTADHLRERIAFEEAARLPHYALTPSERRRIPVAEHEDAKIARDLEHERQRDEEIRLAMADTDTGKAEGREKGNGQ